MLRLRLTIGIVIAALASIASGYRILGIYPYPSLSHQLVFRSVSLELVKRGHEVVVFTTYPMKDVAIANYTEIDLSILVQKWKSQTDFVSLGTNMIKFAHSVIEFGVEVSDTILSHPEMQNILAPNSTEKFDLIIMQHLCYDALYALSERLNIPMMGISSMNILYMQHFDYGNDLSTPYGINFLNGAKIDNFWQRLLEVGYLVKGVHVHFTKTLKIQDKVMRKHFGDTVSPIDKLADRFEIMLVGIHPFLVEIRPSVPNFVYIGGCRFLDGSKPKALPENLKTTLDNAKEGLIYFSMGSNVKVGNLPEAMRNAILSTFAELPYTVIWKSEINLEGLPANVIMKKWCPQQAILMHPNVVLFIFQGGLQSTEEAIEGEVPMLGMPIFADQYANVQLLKERGVAEDLQMSEFSKEAFKRAILKVISNPSYKENIRKLRDLLHDIPYHPMENAIWWIEHVVRHKGAKHLRCKSRDTEMYKLLHLDVIAFLLALLIILLVALYSVLRCIYRKIMRLTRQCVEKSLKIN
ncbi:UDP-glycosyltransferase UGT5 [Megalopta genalis]|uniref:UDP-glycosyltransferase UGT5 n=1 Tax=Megalopta genalis TaxID=115081 RepID=UPI003FD422EE